MNDDKIYLLKTHLKTENDEYLYKIGRSKQQQLIRLTDYPKTYKIILTRACIDSINVEKKLMFHNIHSFCSSKSFVKIKKIMC